MTIRRPTLLVSIFAIAALFAGCPVSSPNNRAEPPPPAAKLEKYGFLRGNLHAHTNFSADSDTPAAGAVRWYEERGFDFIVLTDHNHVTVQKPGGNMLVIPGVEMTMNVSLPAAGGLEEYGVHMNGWFVPPEKEGRASSLPAAEESRQALYDAELKAIQGLGGVASLSHPNDRWTANAAILIRLSAAGLRFFEVYNPAEKSNNDGAPGKPSTEELWDAVLSTGALLYGIAADDSHHYYDAEAVKKTGTEPRVGNLAWVMVRAGASTEAGIKAALLRGDFYSSSGVTLKKLDVSRTAIALEIAPAEGRTYAVKFSGQKGTVLATSTGLSARYEIKKDGDYVRAVVSDSAGKKAWIQPVFSKP